MGAEAAVTQLRRGAVEHCVLAELFTHEGSGTKIQGERSDGREVVAE